MYRNPTQNKKKPTAEAYSRVLKLMFGLKKYFYLLYYLTSAKVGVTLGTEP